VRLALPAFPTLSAFSFLPPVPPVPLVSKFIIPLAIFRGIIGLKNAYLYGK